ncbi:DUF3570 domain-containing protein [Akkermansiaceae bacterium]|nr:DUF3570 domain-containing protein [Akkermansiaceae bacterium]
MIPSRRQLFPALPLLATTTASDGQDVLRYKYQFYDEQNGRIDVQSQYFDYKTSWLQKDGWNKTTFGLRYAVDSLSGMTPTGTHGNDPDDWLFQDIDDTRRVTVVTLEHEMDDHTLSFEYAHSREEDYLSNAVALKWRSELFEKNTTLTAGVSMAFDRVLATPATQIATDQNKDSIDLSLGISQLLGQQTILDVTLGYGNSDGYLADPYRRISQVVDFFGSPNTFNFAENRPDEQDRWVAKIAARHYIPQLKAAVAGSYRFYANSDDLVGHTFELKWIQEINDELSITPYARYYRQSSADFYYPSLTGTGINGTGLIDGTGPHYSSDYRLSSMEAFTVGIKATYDVSESLSFDLQLERYEMNGLSAGTPDIFFPKANVISVGQTGPFKK